MPPAARRPAVAVGVAAVLATALATVGWSAALASPASAATAAGAPSVERDAAPIVLTGAQLPAWSRLPAEGAAKPYPSGSSQVGGDKVRTAHNGTLVVPPDTRKGVDPDTVAAYSWTGSAWREVPVQVDQRFPYFLANGRSDFAFYSGTDQELTYAWAPDQHDTGEEAWKKVFGECAARYAADTAEVGALHAAGVVGYGPQESAEDYLGAMQDPVPTLDDDDEIALRAGDAGAAAPAGEALPPGAIDAQTVTVADPLDPAHPRFLYLVRKPGGSSFTAATSDVRLERDGNADEFIDRASFSPDSPEKLGTSNTGYGPNIPGTVCRTDPANDQGVTAPDGTPRPSKDRFPRDGMTVSTPRYQLHASGRWMVRSYRVAEGYAGGSQHVKYGPDLIDRWKGRAFQQSPDSTVSLVGFEDEQVNWEANSALLGWRAGPVRAIREIWGADSGTNVTKTETYYRDADVFRYHVRVHPIPPDGLYTSWDYNPGAVTTYYNTLRPQGVPIDGINDDTGQLDQLPGTGDPAYFDAPDPTFDLPSAVDRPEEVAGPNGGAVYVFEFKGATSAANAAAVPYYRDDACLDDGTGDAPQPRPYPGDAYKDSNNRVADIYVQRAIAAGAPADLTIDQLEAACHRYADAPSWARYAFQGAFASHGTHFFATHDSDNATLGVPVDEIDGQQWRFAVPMTQPTNVLSAYGPDVVTPLVATVAPYPAAGGSGLPALPLALLLPVGATVAVRRRVTCRA